MDNKGLLFRREHKLVPVPAKPDGGGELFQVIINEELGAWKTSIRGYWARSGSSSTLFPDIGQYPFLGGKHGMGGFCPAYARNPCATGAAKWKVEDLLERLLTGGVHCFQLGTPLPNLDISLDKKKNSLHLSVGDGNEHECEATITIPRYRWVLEHWLAQFFKPQRFLVIYLPEDRELQEATICPEGWVD